jgi:hypothetical protein
MEIDFPPKETWALDCELEDLKDICYKGRHHKNYKQGLHFLLELYIVKNRYNKQDIVIELLIKL